MCIVAVDAEPDSLNDLCTKIRAVFPKESVVPFQNPLEVLKFADQNSIQLLFTDVRLRPFDGYELIKTLRQTQSFFAYVISGTREHPDDLRWMNINGCFAKPITREELQQVKQKITAQ